MCQSRKEDLTISSAKIPLSCTVRDAVVSFLGSGLLRVSSARLGTSGFASGSGRRFNKRLQATRRILHTSTTFRVRDFDVGLDIINGLCMPYFHSHIYSFSKLLLLLLLRHRRYFSTCPTHAFSLPLFLGLPCRLRTFHPLLMRFQLIVLTQTQSASVEHLWTLKQESDGVQWALGRKPRKRSGSRTI